MPRERSVRDGASAVAERDDGTQGTSHATPNSQLFVGNRDQGGGGAWHFRMVPLLYLCRGFTTPELRPVVFFFDPSRTTGNQLDHSRTPQQSAPCWQLRCAPASRRQSSQARPAGRREPTPWGGTRARRLCAQRLPNVLLVSLACDVPAWLRRRAHVARLQHPHCCHRPRPQWRTKFRTR